MPPDAPLLHPDGTARPSPRPASARGRRRPRGGHGPALVALGVVLLVHLGVNLAWLSTAGAPWLRSAPAELAPVVHTVALLRPPLTESDRATVTAQVHFPPPPGSPQQGGAAEALHTATQAEMTRRMLRGLISNQESRYRSSEGPRSYFYKVASPLYYLASALPALVAGPGIHGPRVGPWVILALISLGVYAVAARLARPPVALAAAVMVTLHPGIFGHARSTGPFFGATAGICLLVALAWASRGLRRPLFALGAGIAAALSLRWGETLGDGLEALVCASPALAMLVLDLARSLRVRPARALPGLALFGISLWALSDWAWIEMGISGYILPEALRARPDLRVEQLGRSWSELGSFVPVAIDTLLGPLPALLLALAALPLLIRHRREPHALAVLAWALLPPLLLSVPAKRQNFYLTAMLPGVAIATAIGLRAVPRFGRWLPALASLLLVPAWLYQSFPDHAAWRVLAVDGPARRLLGDSVLEASRSLPTGGWRSGDIYVRPVVELRRSPSLRGDVLHRWLAHSEAGDWIRCAPSNSPLAIVVAAEGAEDVGRIAAIDLASMRDDLRIGWVQSPQDATRWITQDYRGAWGAVLHLPRVTRTQSRLSGPSPVLEPVARAKDLLRPLAPDQGPLLRVYTGSAQAGPCP